MHVYIAIILSKRRVLLGNILFLDFKGTVISFVVNPVVGNNRLQATVYVSPAKCHALLVKETRV